MKKDIQIGKLYRIIELLLEFESKFVPATLYPSFLMDGEIIIPLDINLSENNFSEIRILKTNGEITYVRFRGNWRNYMIPVDEQPIL